MAERSSKAARTRSISPSHSNFTRKQALMTLNQGAVRIFSKSISDVASPPETNPGLKHGGSKQCDKRHTGPDKERITANKGDIFHDKTQCPDSPVRTVVHADAGDGPTDCRRVIQDCKIDCSANKQKNKTRSPGVLNPQRKKIKFSPEDSKGKGHNQTSAARSEIKTGEKGTSAHNEQRRSSKPAFKISRHKHSNEDHSCQHDKADASNQYIHQSCETTPSKNDTLHLSSNGSPSPKDGQKNKSVKSETVRAENGKQTSNRRVNRKGSGNPITPEKNKGDQFAKATSPTQSEISVTAERCVVKNESPQPDPTSHKGHKNPLTRKVVVQEADGTSEDTNTVAKQTARDSRVIISKRNHKLEETGKGKDHDSAKTGSFSGQSSNKITGESEHGSKSKRKSKHKSKKSKDHHGRKSDSLESQTGDLRRPSWKESRDAISSHRNKAQDVDMDIDNNTEVHASYRNYRERQGSLESNDSRNPSPVPLVASDDENENANLESCNSSAHITLTECNIEDTDLRLDSEEWKVDFGSSREEKSNGNEFECEYMEEGLKMESQNSGDELQFESEPSNESSKSIDFQIPITFENQNVNNQTYGDDSLKFEEIVDIEGDSQNILNCQDVQITSCDDSLRLINQEYVTQNFNENASLEVSGCKNDILQSPNIGYANCNLSYEDVKGNSNRMHSANCSDENNQFPWMEVKNDPWEDKYFTPDQSHEKGFSRDNHFVSVGSGIVGNKSSNTTKPVSFRIEKRQLRTPEATRGNGGNVPGEKSYNARYPHNSWIQIKTPREMAQCSKRTVVKGTDSNTLQWNPTLEKAPSQDWYDVQDSPPKQYVYPSRQQDTSMPKPEAIPETEVPPLDWFEVQGSPPRHVLPSTQPGTSVPKLEPSTVTGVPIRPISSPNSLRYGRWMDGETPECCQDDDVQPWQQRNATNRTVSPCWYPASVTKEEMRGSGMEQFCMMSSDGRLVHSQWPMMTPPGNQLNIPLGPFPRVSSMPDMNPNAQSLAAIERGCYSPFNVSQASLSGGSSESLSSVSSIPCVPRQVGVHSEPRTWMRAGSINFSKIKRNDRLNETYGGRPERWSGEENKEKKWVAYFKKRYQDIKVPYIDSHCHIDFLFNRTFFKGSFQRFMTMNCDTFPDSYDGCVAVFCDPNKFSAAGGLWRDLLQDPKIWGAMGCHPKSAEDYNEFAEENLKICLDHPRMVAVGEIGLDYSGKHADRKTKQQFVLRRQINIALEKKKPLVIHCRDAYDDCLEILQETVPKNYKIHLHCFTQNWIEAQRWLSVFPNLYLGLTPLITYRTALASQNTALMIPLDRLLLETDAPYFVPYRIPREDMPHSHPGMAITVANEVASIKKISLHDVLLATRENTRNMYGI